MITKLTLRSTVVSTLLLVVSSISGIAYAAEDIEKISVFSPITTDEFESQLLALNNKIKSSTDIKPFSGRHDTGQERLRQFDGTGAIDSIAIGHLDTSNIGISQPVTVAVVTGFLVFRALDLCLKIEVYRGSGRGSILRLKMAGLQPGLHDMEV